MKKVIKIGAVLLIMLSILTNAYAASCTITVQPSNSKVETNKEFSVDVVLSNIQDEKGMITFTARLEYDHTNLTFKKIEGQNGWNPAYNEENGKIAAERAGGYTKSDETVFRVTFLANGAVNETPKITLTDIVFSNGKEDIDVTAASTTVTIIDSDSGNQGGNQGGNEGGNQGGNQGGNEGGNEGGNQGGNEGGNEGGNQGGNEGGNEGGNQNTNKVDTSIKDGKLPQTGDMNILLIVIAVAIALVVGLFIKIKLINNKVNKN